jgi:O-acetyl-ADP-ribose deacetylase (regulator of RNase III)
MVALRQSRLSQLFASVRFNRLDIQIHISYDILFSAPLARYDFLVNPANQALCGVRQPYFPIGGPVPPMIRPDKALSSSHWGGMEAGENMMYGVQVLDGAVHDECGPQLMAYLQSLPSKGVDAVGQIIRCPEGSAVCSPCFGSLVPYFGRIIHTVAPFQSDPDWERKLESCYRNVFRLAWPSPRKVDGQVGTGLTMSTPLLGAGCRGISIENAARVAAKACRENGHQLIDETGTTVEHNDDVPSLHFVLREEEHCQALHNYLTIT